MHCVGNEKKNNNNFKVIKNEGLLEWDKEFEDMRDKFVSDEAFEAYKSIFEYARTHPEEIDEIDRELDRELGIDDDEDESHYEVIEEKQKEYERLLSLVKSLEGDGVISNISYSHDCRYNYKNIDFNFILSHLNKDNIKQIILILKISEGCNILKYKNSITIVVGIDDIYKKK